MATASPFVRYDLLQQQQQQQQQQPSSPHSYGAATDDTTPQRLWPGGLLAPPKTLLSRHEAPLQFIPLTPPGRREAIHSKLPAALLTPLVKNLSAGGALADYSRLLEFPTMDTAAKACALLDSSMHNSSKTELLLPPRIHPPPPAAARVSREGTTGALSPLYWPLDNSRSSAMSSTAVGSIAMMEWEVEIMLNPFFLLAGAEVLAADLAHIVAPFGKNGGVSSLTALTGLYQLIQVQLQRTKETLLCEQPLMTSSLALALSPDSSGGCSVADEWDSVAHVKEATYSSIATSIDALCQVVNTRCQLIELQSLLFRTRSSKSRTSSKELTQAANATSGLLEAFLAAVPGGVHANDPVKGILVNLQRELKCWKFCFETCAFLDRCDFTNTLLSLRRWKATLPRKSVDNRLTRWMHWTTQQVKSLLPIYFDKVYAFASPLHGFDTAKLWQNRIGQQQQQLVDDGMTNWDGTIQEFLRRHAKSGGECAIALSLVLDASCTGVSHLERGYQTLTPVDRGSGRDRSGDDDFITQASSTRWPALYIRSSTRLVHASTTLPSPHSSSVWSSQSSMLRPSGQISPPGVSKRKQSLLGASPSISTPKSSNALANQPLLEYTPDAGDAHCFPHTSWESLENLLDNNKSTGGVSQVKSYYYEDEHDKSVDPKGHHEQKAPLFSFGWSDSRRQETSPIGVRRLRHHSYHVAFVGEWLRAVVLVEGRLDDSKRHGRRNSTNSEDVRAFLSDLAQGLSVRSLISKESLSHVDARMCPLELPSVDVSSPDNEVQTQHYLNAFKARLGLRPSSQFLKERSIYSPRRFGSRSPVVAKQNRLGQQLPDMADSAAFFFLGSDLAVSLISHSQAL